MKRLLIFLRKNKVSRIPVEPGSYNFSLHLGMTNEQLLRVEKRDSVQHGGATDEKRSEGRQKRITLHSVDFNQTKTQEDKDTKTKKGIAEV
jgi:hypothetical protein